LTDTTKVSVAILLLGLVTIGCSRESAGPSTAAKVAASPDVSACDSLAAHPDDPQKSDVPGVEDAKIDADKAIEACAKAAETNPDVARLQFQLGRAYWVAERYEEAIETLIEAAELGHGGALAYLGDAALYGAAGLDPDPETAKGLYEQAAAAGFKPAAALAADIVAGATPAAEPATGGNTRETVYHYPAMIASLSSGVTVAKNMSEGQALLYYVQSAQGVAHECPGAFPRGYDFSAKADQAVGNHLNAQERDSIIARINQGVLVGFMQEALDDGFVLAHTKGCQAPETQALVRAVLKYLS
jgi:tetratricopeptide (TPR) repeat protein